MQIDGLQHRCPSRSDLSCRTDSLVEIVSRYAVFDRYRVLRINHDSSVCMTGQVIF